MDRFEELLSRYLDGGLAPGEERELLDLLGDPERERIFAELTRLDGEVAGVLSGPIPDAKMAEVVLKDLEQGGARKDSTRVMAVLQRIEGEGLLRRRRRRARFLAGRRAEPVPAWWIAIPAALAGLVLVALALRPSAPSAPPAPERVTRTPSVEEPEPLPAPAPRPRAPETPKPRPKRPVVENPPAPPLPPPAPSPRPERNPEPAPSKPSPATRPPERRTVAAVRIARVESVSGRVAGARVGEGIVAGQTVATEGPNGRAVLVFPDGTRITLGGDTDAREFSVEDGKKFFLARGVLEADVRRQPPNRPMIVSTPHGEARVLGTAFSLRVDEDSTRLDVDEGRVRLTPAGRRSSVVVRAGHFAVAGAGLKLEARRRPIDGIVLLPDDGKLFGREWKRVSDRESSSGIALDILQTANFIRIVSDAERAQKNDWFVKGRSRSWVQFTFEADAGRDYHVWVRGRCLAPPGAAERFRKDAVFLEAPGGKFRRPQDWFQYADRFSPVDGYSNHPGYWWSGGSHDPNKSMAPLVLRFDRPGRQVLRVHGFESPMRIDGLWLSTRQKTRPAEGRAVPAELRRRR